MMRKAVHQIRHATDTEGQAMRARASEHGRAKISVTVDPTMPRLVDRFIESHPDTVAAW
jgi:hypothetical protein